MLCTLAIPSRASTRISDQPDAAVDEELDEVAAAVAVPLQQRRRRGGAVDHHRAEREQAQRRGQQDAVLERAARALACGPARERLSARAGDEAAAASRAPVLRLLASLLHSTPRAGCLRCAGAPGACASDRRMPRAGGAASVVPLCVAAAAACSAGGRRSCASGVRAMRERPRRSRAPPAASWPSAQPSPPARAERLVERQRARPASLSAKDAASSTRLYS